MQHRALENLSRLSCPSPSVADYVQHLQAMLGVVALVEETFYRSPRWRAVMPDHAERLRADLLRADLLELGTGLAGAVAPPILALETFAHGMGAAYVLEGSTLGGSVLVGRVRTSFGPHAPVRFLSVHGAHVRAMWTRFCNALEATIGAAEREDASTGAVRTFEAFRTSFEGR